MQMFLGVDLGWYEKPSGLASVRLAGDQLELVSVARISSHADVLDWLRAEVADASAVAGVDAPLVIPNATGIRVAERELNREFRRFDAGCHAANLGRPFAARVTAFSRALEAMAFRHGALMAAREWGRFQIEVHPHAAAVSLFGLPRIVKYKRGLRAERAEGLRQFRRLLTKQLPRLEPPLSVMELPSIPRTGNLKPVEDVLDAVLCAYIAAHWWHWGCERNRVYGTNEDGYIVVPGALR